MAKERIILKSKELLIDNEIYCKLAAAFPQGLARVQVESNQKYCRYFTPVTETEMNVTIFCLILETILDRTEVNKISDSGILIDRAQCLLVFTY